MLHWKSLKKYTFPPNETQKMVLAWLFQGLEPFLDHKKPWIHTHTHTSKHTDAEVILTQAFSWQKERWPIFTKGNNHRERECWKKMFKKIPLRWEQTEDKGVVLDFFLFFLLSLTLTSCSAIVLHKWAPKTEMGKKTQGRFCAHRPRGLERGRVESWHPVMQPLVF